ncbi:MAG: glycosyltransferase family 2 protein [Lachnospiraceae bacterium]|nr:glycosyltransferase family 2 protein [Lachnospiraceae bacterium]
MKQTKKLSVVIPAYNESAGIGNTLEELLACMDMQDTEIIVVDDGSTDDTAEIVKGFSQVRLICHTENKGYGTAIKTGARAATGEIVAWYDSDGQHRPEDLKKVVDEITEKNLDYCIGVRGKDSYVDKTRVFGKFILRLFLRIVTFQKVTDFNSGLRAFKREVLLRYLSLLPKRFGASTVTTLLMQEEDYNGSEVPITVRKRIGRSSVKQIRDGFRTIMLIMNVILLFHPMRVLGTSGAVMILAGLIYGGICALQYGGGFPVFAAVLIIFGFQLFCFGLLSHQISRVRKEKFEDPGIYAMMNMQEMTRQQ